MAVSADDNYQRLCLNRTLDIVFYDTQYLNVLHTCKTVPRSRTMLWVCDNKQGFTNEAWGRTNIAAIYSVSVK
jgi:hypothetical protein